MLFIIAGISCSFARSLLERDEFDLVAVGRALQVDPAWPRKVQEAHYDELLPFEPAALATLS